MKYRYVFSIDALFISIALVAPSFFVTATSSVWTYIFRLKGQGTGCAYGIALFVVAAACAISRRCFWQIGLSSTSNSKATAMSAGVVLVAAYGFFTACAEVVTVESVVEGYLSYVTSVFFCIGAGYCFADVFSAINSSVRK